MAAQLARRRPAEPRARIACSPAIAADVAAFFHEFATRRMVTHARRLDLEVVHGER